MGTGFSTVNRRMLFSVNVYGNIGNQVKAELFGLRFDSRMLEIGMSSGVSDRMEKEDTMLLPSRAP